MPKRLQQVIGPHISFQAEAVEQALQRGRLLTPGPNLRWSSFASICRTYRSGSPIPRWHDSRPKPIFAHRLRTMAWHCDRRACGQGQPQADGACAAPTHDVEQTSICNPRVRASSPNLVNQKLTMSPHAQRATDRGAENVDGVLHGWD